MENAPALKWAPATILHLSPTGIVEWTNRDELKVGANLFDFTPETQHEQLRAIIAQGMEGGHGFETTLEDDADKRHLQVQISAVGDPATSVILLVLDITKQRTEAERTKQAEEDAVRAQQMQVERARKQKFLNAVGHQLKTPLTPLRLQLSLLRSAGDDQTRMRSLDVIERNVERMQRLIEHLVEVSELQEGKQLPIGDVPAGTLIAQALNRVESIARAHDVRLETTLEYQESFPVDERRMLQVLQHLLVNAIEHSKPGQVVHIDTTIGPAIEVRDGGTGLTNGDLEQIFEPFNQVQGHEEGPGLGLYVSRAIVEAHGARLEAYSKGQGHGATFRVNFQ